MGRPLRGRISHLCSVLKPSEPQTSRAGVILGRNLKILPHFRNISRQLDPRMHCYKFRTKSMNLRLLVRQEKWHISRNAKKVVLTNMCICVCLGCLLYAWHFVCLKKCDQIKDHIVFYLLCACTQMGHRCVLYFQEWGMQHFLMQEKLGKHYQYITINLKYAFH